MTFPADTRSAQAARSGTVVAGVDCGTNSIRLLIADVAADGTLVERVRMVRVVRLGQGVDRTGVLDEAALARTFAAAQEFAQECARHGVGAIRFVATSAIRDAANRQVFVDGIASILGVVPEVISGVEEAELSFIGATSALGEHRPLVLTVDLGGGSTEFVLGDERPLFVASMDVGSVRMTERHMRSDPPTPDQLAAAVADIDAALDEAGTVIPFERTGTLIGLAGTVTTVTAHALRLPAYDRSAINGAVLTPEAVLAACGELVQSTVAERSAMPYVHPGRVDITGAGALIWARVVARVAAEVQLGGGRLDGVMTSEHDILDGITLSLR